MGTTLNISFIEIPITSKHRPVKYVLEMTLRLNCQMLREFSVYPGVVKMLKTAKVESEAEFCISEEH